MKNWFLAVSGYRRVTVRGAAPERFLNLCAREGVPIREPRRPGPGTLSLIVPAEQAELVSELAGRCGGEAALGPLRGMPGAWRLAKRRRFVLILLALALLISLVSFVFVWDIRVSGNETISTGEILRALEECGVSCGKCWLWMNATVLQSRLRLRLPQIQWASFQISGGRMRVIITEAVTAPPPIDNAEPVDLVAVCPGIITRMTVLQGEPAARRGDLVSPGQTLVSGIAEDRQGERRTVHALGEIRARTDWELTATLPLERTRRVPTGEGHSRWALLFGKKRLNFSQNSGIPTAECDTIYHEYVCAIPGVFRLPVSLLREERREVTLMPERLGEQEARSLLEQTLRRALAEKLGEDGEILDLRFTQHVTDDAFTLTLRAECEQNIAIERNHSE